MSIESKPWDWKNVKDNHTDSFWLEPAPESYYLVDRWKKTYGNAPKFLDLGSGLGRHAIFFAQNGFQVSAIDLSKKGIEESRTWAEKEGLAIDFVVGDMLHPPYGDSTFDCLMAFQVINHTDTEGVINTINEIHRVMKPGGEFYITLASKKAWGWEQNWPKVDENTKLRMEEGPEWEVPHFYTDYNTIFSLFEKFELTWVQEELTTTNEKSSGQYVDEYGMRKGGWHWRLLGKKK